MDGRGTRDLLLVYLSCHGLLDVRRLLYFAATDTRKDRLGSTGVEAAWVLDQLEHCRARRQVLILDSCFSGAFAHGAKGEADLGLRDRFLGQGRGRVVLTASTATEYSFEGDPTDAVATAAGSVFTAALVQGLRTGEADTDHDGHVSVDDSYAYVFDQVQAAGAAQTPQRWLYGVEGQILLARNPAGPTIIPAPLPESLRAGLDSPHPSIRIGAVTELGEWLTGGDPARAATARRHLREVADTDIPRVAVAARTLLDTGTTAEPPAPAIPRTTATEAFTWADLQAGSLSGVRVFTLYFPSRFDLPVDAAATEMLRAFGAAMLKSTSVVFWDPADVYFSEALGLFGLGSPPALVLVNGLQDYVAGVAAAADSLYCISFADPAVLTERASLAAAVNFVHEVLVRCDKAEIADCIRRQNVKALLTAIGRGTRAVRGDIVRLHPQFSLPGGFSIELGD